MRAARETIMRLLEREIERLSVQFSGTLGVVSREEERERERNAREKVAYLSSRLGPVSPGPYESAESKEKIERGRDCRD